MSTYEHVLERHSPRARGWCFTINNFSEEEKNKISELIGSGLTKYGIAEVEKGDREGTPHIQGYIYFENAQTFDRVKILIGERAHIEKAAAGPKENYIYCSKDNNVFAIRDLPKCLMKAGFLEKRKDMLELTPHEFEEKYPQFYFFNQERILKRMIEIHKPLVKDYTGDLHAKNYWLWGESRVGKSSWARAQGTYYDTDVKKVDKWFDGFDIFTTRVLIIDEFPSYPESLKHRNQLCIWGDRYPTKEHIKGAMLWIEPRKFFLIITSNYSPRECFPDDKDYIPITERFNVVEVKKGDLFSTKAFRLDRSILQLE